MEVATPARRRRRNEVLRALYHAGLVDEFLQRARAPAVLVANDCLPDAWREHGYRATEAANPRFEGRDGASRSRKPGRILLDGKPLALQHAIVEAYPPCLYTQCILTGHWGRESAMVTKLQRWDNSLGVRLP